MTNSADLPEAFLQVSFTQLAAPNWLPTAVERCRLRESHAVTEPARQGLHPNCGHCAVQALPCKHCIAAGLGGQRVAWRLALPRVAPAAHRFASVQVQPCPLPPWHAACQQCPQCRPLPAAAPLLLRLQGIFSEVEGYDEDCTPESLPEVSGEEYTPLSKKGHALDQHPFGQHPPLGSKKLTG